MLYLLKTLFFIDVLVGGGLLLFRWALLPRDRPVVSGKLVAIALATPAVALLCANVYLLFLYLAAVVAFNARSRAELAGTYLFMLPLMPMLTVESRVGGFYLFGISVTMAMGLGALVGFVIGKARRTPTLTRYDLAMWAQVAIFVLIYNRDPSATGLIRMLVLNVLTIAGPYFLVSRAARDAAELERLLLRLCLGATIVGVTALFQARRHWVIFETYYQSLHVPTNLGTAAMALRAGLLRTGGSMVDYSAAGLFLAAIITLLPLLRRHFSVVGFWTVAIVIIGGLLVTQSRGAWVAAIAGMTVVAAHRGRWGRVLLLAGGAAVAEMMVLLFATSGPLAEVLGKTDEAAGNLDYRRRLATQGLDQIIAHPLGQPVERLVQNLSDLTQGQHIVDFVNGHLFIAMAGGVPTFLVWCVIWLLPIVEGWRHRREALLAIVPTTIIVPAMVAVTFTSIGDRNLTWPTIALGLAPACFAYGRRTADAAGRNARNTAAAATARPPRQPAVISLSRVGSA